MATKTLTHVEPIDELLQMDSAMEQDLEEAVLARLQEIVEENGIDEDDIIDYLTSIELKITIKYKNGKSIQYHCDKCDLPISEKKYKRNKGLCDSCISEIN